MCSCGTSGRHKGRATKTVMTALGAIILWRTYFSCNTCRTGGYTADHFLGLDGFLTRQATRLVCLLGGQNSFAVTERLLRECCGWTISDERIRQACQAESPRIADFRADSPAVAEAFADAPGDVEFQTDAAKVNTTEGWRDMKIGIFARRERGERSTPEDWDKRHLPAPTTRVAFAAIETIDDFGPRWSEWAVRLGIKDLSTIPVLGDGAEWIWNAASLPAVPKSSTSTMPPSTSPARRGASSERELRRRQNGWNGAAVFCCPMVGPAFVTTWDRQWGPMMARMTVRHLTI
jgi:hypothetical protein